MAKLTSDELALVVACLKHRIEQAEEFISDFAFLRKLSPYESRSVVHEKLVKSVLRSAIAKIKKANQ